METSLPILPGPTKEELGQCLRNLRLALGWTTEELAKRAGLLVSLLDDVERGRDSLELNVFEAIALGLGVTPGTIVRLCERRVVFQTPDQS